jgi:hypothetical protein
MPKQKMTLSGKSAIHIDLMDEYLETIIERGEDSYYQYEGEELKVDTMNITL